MAESPPGDRQAAADQSRLIDAIRIDLERLHAVWMSLMFPRQLQGAHSVLGRWKPRSTGARIGYSLWSKIGILTLVVAYPLAVIGFAIRYYTMKLDRTATSIGLLGVIILSIIVWGGLTVVAYLRFFTDGFYAVGAAAIVATISAVLGVVFSRVGGRFTTVLLAYPFAMTALFLPPVVAALFSPSLANYIFPRSTLLASWILENILTVGGIGTYLSQRFDLVGPAYVGMWFGIAVPVGWFMGFLVTLANLVRPSG